MEREESPKLHGEQERERLCRGEPGWQKWGETLHQCGHQARPRCREQTLLSSAKRIVPHIPLGDLCVTDEPALIHFQCIFTKQLIYALQEASLNAYADPQPGIQVCLGVKGGLIGWVFI